MNVICNGEERQTSSDIAVEKYIQELGLDPDSVVAECNGRILKREEYDTHILTEGAVLELIRFVGGG